MQEQRTTTAMYLYLERGLCGWSLLSCPSPPSSPSFFPIWPSYSEPSESVARLKAPLPRLRDLQREAQVKPFHSSLRVVGEQGLVPSSTGPT